MIVVNLFLVSILGLSSAAAASTSTALAGCPERCGNISVPYPFGIKPGCFKEGFNLTCKETFQPPRLLLDTNRSSIEVTAISLEKGLVYAKNPIALPDTINLPTVTVVGPYVLPVNGPYTLSTQHNVFTAIGCGNLASFVDPQLDDSYAMCAAICRSKAGMVNGSCSGIGCCQAAIPPGITSYEIQLRILNQTQYVAIVSSMKAFLVQKDWFTFNSNYLFSSLFNQSTMVPIVVGWTAGKSTCEDAMKNKTSFACLSNNSQCLAATDGGVGYICGCSEGYQGNPYLPNGCQDIDECQSKRPPCDRCINKPGSYICLPSSSSTSSSGRKNSVLLGVIIGVSIGVGLVLPLVSSALLYRKWKERKMKELRRKHFHQNRGLLMQQLISSNEGSTERTKIYSLQELEKATNNFDSTRILGRGGHGTVYKGMLSDQCVVAIKKSKLMVQSEIDQFINEVVILSQINHRNIVKLFGCCLETEVPLLVYEFVSNKTLYDHLHVQDHESSLSWEDRLRIATETAGALAYMHSAASISVFHRDVKSSNILLDDNYTAKLSDFGTSRSIPLHQTRVTTAVQGTFGYLDPEYFYTSRLTEKSDVYSFGVILAELLTGEKPVSLIRVEEERNLATHFLQSLQENHLSQLLKPRILREATREEIEAVARIAEGCLSLRGEERPLMKEVEMRLLELRGYKKQQHPWDAQSNEETKSLLSDLCDVGNVNDASRQYSMEQENLLSMSHPR